MSLISRILPFGRGKVAGATVKNPLLDTGRQDPNDDFPQNVPRVAENDFALGDDPVLEVYDPGSQSHVQISSQLITTTNGACPISGSMQELLVASASGEIYYSRSHQASPLVISEIYRIEKMFGQATVKLAVDMSTIAEIYRKMAHLTRNVAGMSGSAQQSRMQRDFMSVVARAKEMGVSDIYIIINPDSAEISFRINNSKRRFRELQPQYAYDLLSATFALADESDTSYQVWSNQAAVISSAKTELPAGVISLRLQFNPLVNEGRELVVRVLTMGADRDLELEDLGYGPDEIAKIHTMMAQPIGIKLFSGPTGTGKSTTLKAVLEFIYRSFRGEKRILTIEDPPEYTIRGAQQMPVTNAKTQAERDEAFTQAISAGLRSKPDIMMIGEIRDKSSAFLAIEGALSGHPIYASFHANSAIDIVTRLRGMGVQEYLLFDHNIFTGLTSQRLPRRTCPHCCRPYEVALAEGEIDEIRAARVEKMLSITPAAAGGIEKLMVANPDGCEHCDRGYNGAAMVSETVIPDAEFMDRLRTDQKEEARKYWLTEMGGVDLLSQGWIKAMGGEVSPLEVENSIALLNPIAAHEAVFSRVFSAPQEDAAA